MTFIRDFTTNNVHKLNTKVKTCALKKIINGEPTTETNAISFTYHKIKLAWSEKFAPTKDDCNQKVKQFGKTIAQEVRQYI